MQRYLNEIELAYLLGFRRWRDFEKALRGGHVPAPDRQYPDGPRWSGVLVESQLSGRLDTLEAMGREDALIERLESVGTAPLPRAAKSRR